VQDGSMGDRDSNIHEMIVTDYGFTTTKRRSELMKRIKSKDTTPEVEFRKQFWARGYRYRVNYSRLPGKPDIAFTKYSVAVFIDGEFWHGYNWNEKRERIKSNRDYWIRKIEGNMARDKKATVLLQDMGWTVVRFWEHEVKREPLDCVNRVLHLLNK
jgi:DNA mismatch endonuclease (patch repair protein)